MPSRPKSLRNADVSDELQADTYWKDRRYQYNANGQLTYIGRHLDHKASEDDTHWYCWKYSWQTPTSTKPSRVQGYLLGAWSSVATLDW